MDKFEDRDREFSHASYAIAAVIAVVSLFLIVIFW